MKIESLKTMEKEFGCKFNIQSTGSPEWIRMFVIDSQGRSIGRCNFKNEKLYNIKNYKRSYIETLDETDKIFLRINKYIKDKILVPLEEYYKLVIEAKQLQHSDIVNKIAWREANQKFCKNGKPVQRRKLKGRNIRFILKDLVMAWECVK